MGIDVLIACFIGFLTLLSVIFFLRNFGSKTVISSENKIETDVYVDENKPVKKSANKVQHLLKDKKSDNKFNFDHNWLIGVLKGHSDNISGIDISSNNRYIASTGNDRSLYIWKVKDLRVKDRRVIRSNVQYDSATNVKFSPDDKALILSLDNKSLLRAVKIKREEKNFNLQEFNDFTEMESPGAIIDFAISPTGQYMMTCYNQPSVCCKLWSLKGRFLHQIDTGTMINYGAIMSPCGRFVVPFGFSSDVRFWLVEFNKVGDELKDVSKVFTLGGHNSSVVSAAFTSDSSRIVTLSIDGEWKLWDISHDYKRQDPKLISSGTCSLPNVTKGPKNVLTCLSTDASCLAIAYNTNLIFVNITTKIIEIINSCHPDNITGLCYLHKESIFLSSGGRYINIWDDQVTKQTALDNLEQKLKNHLLIQKQEKKPVKKDLENEKIMQQISNIKTLSHFEKIRASLNYNHTSVLLNEVINLFNETDKQLVFDLTFGFGGHSKEIIKNESIKEMYCIDRDSLAFHYATNLANNNYKVKPYKSKFSEIEHNVCKNDIFRDSIDFILMDLGCSSMQMDDHLRGFSLSKDAKLDMRMDIIDNESLTAYDVINNLGYIEMREVLKKYGQVKEPSKIAKTIIDYRLTVGPISTTKQLADIVWKCVYRQQYTDSLNRNSHPATLVFQAFRIFVNDELNELAKALIWAKQYLKPNSGILAVISFHSLEDKLIKLAFQNKKYSENANVLFEDINNKTKYQPNEQIWQQIGDIILPSVEEISSNPRSRSAKLRAGRKIVVK